MHISSECSGGRTFQKGLFCVTKIIGKKGIFLNRRVLPRDAFRRRKPMELVE